MLSRSHTAENPRTFDMHTHSLSLTFFVLTLSFARSHWLAITPLRALCSPHTELPSAPAPKEMDFILEGEGGDIEHALAQVRVPASTEGEAPSPRAHTTQSSPKASSSTRAKPTVPRRSAQSLASATSASELEPKLEAKDKENANLSSPTPPETSSSVGLRALLFCLSDCAKTHSLASVHVLILFLCPALLYVFVYLCIVCVCCVCVRLCVFFFLWTRACVL
jgi:hypothetical protein